MKMYASWVSEYWRYLSSDSELKGSRVCQCPRFIFSTLVKLSWIIVSVLAFLLKLSQVKFATDLTRDPWRDWTFSEKVTFFGFLNNMVSLTNPWALQLNTVYKFLFAGPDAQFQANELRVLEEFQEAIVYRLIKANGVIKGMALLLTWSYVDVQSVLLEESEKFKIADIDDDAPSTGEFQRENLSSRLLPPQTLGSVN